MAVKHDVATRTASDVQEDRVASKLGGFRTSNSGANRFRKGDIHINEASLLVECKTKTTESKSMSIKKEWLEKNSSEALFMGKEYNALAFNFGPNTDNYYIIDELTFNYLINLLENKK